MTAIALFGLGLLFGCMFVRGFFAGRMPSRFATAIRHKQPVRYFMNAWLIAVVAIVCLTAAFTIGF
jgi:hypothetical protein